MVTYASTLPHGATSFRAASRLAASFEMSKVGPTIPLKCGLQLAVPLLKRFHDREATLKDLKLGFPCCLKLPNEGFSCWIRSDSGREVESPMQDSGTEILRLAKETFRRFGCLSRGGFPDLR